MNNRKDTGWKSCREAFDIPYITEKYEALKGLEAKYALVQFNIKNFRYYNTKYGWSSGDEILLLIFQRMRSLLEEGEYCAYLYADNFVMLLQYEDANGLMYERMMNIIDKMYRIEDERIYRDLFISMGIYEIVDKLVEFQDAVNYANLCRKESTGLPKRNFCMELYDITYYQSYMDRMNLETETADAYKNYEFVTYIQPKVDLKAERIIGGEALLRWFDKEGKSIPLYKFLPILNQNGYIELLDLDTFDQMCQYLEQRIQNKERVVPISFNISKTSFYDPNLIEGYIKVFEKYQIPKELIEIELMESISLSDTAQMKTVVEGFKKYGFCCSLDDFGNGYSSFNVLLNAELDIVKIDRQLFLNNLNGDAKLIIKTMVDLIHSLKMKVVAEGVEMKEHIDCLKEYGCDYVQGYYYFQPMPLDAFSALLDAQAAEMGGEAPAPKGR